VNGAAVQAVVQVVLALISTGALYKFLNIRADRRKIVGEATSAEANAATTLTGGALELVESVRQDVRDAREETRAAKAENRRLRTDLTEANERIDHLEDEVAGLRQRERDLEEAMRVGGVPVPPRLRPPGGTVSQYAKVTLGQDSSGRTITGNRRTAAMIREAERRLGRRLTIVQGSFNKGTAASAGTHDGGGVVDFRSWDLGVGIPDVLTALRHVGLAAWYRTRAQGFEPHIHAVAIGDKQLAPAAKAQVSQYRAGLNGLANRGRDDGPKVKIRPSGLVKRIVAVRLAQRDLDRWRADHEENS
jgi:hypothetical protein